MSFGLSQTISCNVFTTKDLQNPKQVSILHDTTFQEFLDKCSIKLEIQAKRVFQMNGEEIKHIHLIAPDENLIVTEGEEVSNNLLRNYYKTSVKNSGSDEIIANFNIAIIGPAGVGKSSLVVRYVYSTFSNEYIPTLEDQYKKFERVDEDLFGLNILDTSGTEDFVSLVSEWIINKDGLILAYSIEDYEHFKALEKWVQKILYHDPNNEIPKILVANKADLKNRKVKEEDGRAFAEKIGAQYFETSAKNDKGVQAAFIGLIRMMKKNIRRPVREPSATLTDDKNEGGREDKSGFVNWLFSKCNLI